MSYSIAYYTVCIYIEREIHTYHGDTAPDFAMVTWRVCCSAMRRVPVAKNHVRNHSLSTRLCPAKVRDACRESALCTTRPR